MKAYQKQLIDLLLSYNALKFGNFTTKSGRHSPYFVNMGEIKTGKALSILSNIYAQKILEILENKDSSNIVLYGPAYKGIPLVTSVSITLYREYNIELGFTFNRKEKKDHGEGGILIGQDIQNKDVLILEDVITAGTSLYETYEILKYYNARPIGAIVAIDREEKGKFTSLNAKAEIKNKLGFDVFPILNISSIIDYLHQTKNIPNNTYESIIKYLNQN